MEIEHRYGSKVHLLGDPYVLSLLARIGAPDTGTDVVTGLVRTAYRRLFAAVLASEFPHTPLEAPTRMTATEPRAVFRGPALCRRTKLVVCAVIRAGILPAQTCYEVACEILPPGNVRLDFLNLSRITDASGHVIGVRLAGSNIGGPIDDAVVVIPDPMCATGGTVERVVRIYQDAAGAPPLRFVALHLMVTPEAIQRLTATLPDLEIYAGRLDRGMSAPDVLESIPGTYPDRERGLDEQQYIVPGAGGMGELLTNAWV